MSLTIEEVQKRFLEGRAGNNSTGNCRSERGVGPYDGAHVLYSYSTPVAIRRDADGVTFGDAHAYSVTTSRHQINGDACVPFDCLTALMGADWWRTASIQDSGPRACRNDACANEREDIDAARRAAARYNGPDGRSWYRAYWYPGRSYGYGDGVPGSPFGSYRPDVYGPRTTYDAGAIDGEGADPRHDQLTCPPDAVPYDHCVAPNSGADEDGPHAVTIPDYRHWHAAVLLSFGDGRQIVTGFEPGKRARYGGRTDQLWAAILPQWAGDIRRAFVTLRPQSLRDADADAGRYVRQGDLYFVRYSDACPCLCHDAAYPFYPDAWTRAAGYGDAIPTPTAPDGRPLLRRDGIMRVRHGCNEHGPGARHSCVGARNPYAHGAVNIGPAALPILARSPGNHTARHAVIFPGTRPFGDSFTTVLVRGRVEHPQHPTVRFADWYGVMRGRAARAVSSPYHAGGAGAD